MVGHSGCADDFAKATEIDAEIAKPITKVKETNFFQFITNPYRQKKKMFGPTQAPKVIADFDASSSFVKREKIHKPLF
jgi:hypothetical protein